MEDTDFDGLPDAQELNIGSDPQNSDSDGDGRHDLFDYLPPYPGAYVTTAGGTGSASTPAPLAPEIPLLQSIVRSGQSFPLNFQTRAAVISQHWLNGFRFEVQASPPFDAIEAIKSAWMSDPLMALNFPALAPADPAENALLNLQNMHAWALDLILSPGSPFILKSYSSLRSYDYGTPPGPAPQFTAPPVTDYGGEALERKVRLTRSIATPNAVSRSYLLVDRQKTDSSLTAWTVNSVTADTLTIPENLTVSNIIHLDVPAGVIHDPGKTSWREIALVPVEVKVISRDEPLNNWDTGVATSGPAFTSPTIADVPDVKNGDLISWRIGGLTDGTFQWWATGPNGSRKDAPPSVTTSEWKLEDPLDWLPGTWRIHCRYTPSGGAPMEFDFEQKLGYRSPDITVLGWIDGTKIDLPAEHWAKIPATIGVPGAVEPPIGEIMDRFTLRGTFLATVGMGGIYTIPLMGNGAREYVNAYLLKNSPNDTPPAEFKTMWAGYDDRFMVDEEKLAEFRGDLTNFRSFHRFQARFELNDDGTIKGQPFYIKRDTEAGKTPVDWMEDPSGETGLHNGNVNTTGAVVQFNPKNGMQHSASLADDFEQYAQGRISTDGPLSGGNISKNLNNLKVPWIWSITEFDAQHATGGSTAIHEHEIFPVYHFYYNGVRLDQYSNTISRAILEQFIQLGDNP